MLQLSVASNWEAMVMIPLRVREKLKKLKLQKDKNSKNPKDITEISTILINKKVELKSDF